MVDFQYSIMHAHILDSWSELLIEYIPCGIKIFVVDTYRENKVPQFALRNALSPRHFFQGLESKPIMVQIVLRSLVDDVSKRHVCIQELEGFLFVHGQSHRIQIHSGRFHYIGTTCEVLCNPVTDLFVRNEMLDICASA